MDDDEAMELEMDAARTRIARTLMNIGELCELLYEGAEGVRVDMLKRGFTDQQALDISAVWLTCTMPAILR